MIRSEGKLNRGDSQREPMVGGNRRRVHGVPLSKLSVKAERVSPLSLFESGSEAFPSNMGGNTGVTLVPIFGIEGFFIYKKPFILHDL